LKNYCPGQALFFNLRKTKWSW